MGKQSYTWFVRTREGCLQQNAMKCSLFRCFFILVFTLLASGCATPTQKISGNFSRPNLIIGPVFDVLKIKTAQDSAKALIDGDGLGHVLVNSSEQESVHHVVVGREGVISDEIIATSASFGFKDAAFDSAGRLHVLFGRQHLVKERGGWSSSAPTPWSRAGIKAESATFVPGARELTWAVRVKGEEIDAPGRWDLFGFGGYGAGIVFPWHVGSTKLLLTTDTQHGQPGWIAIDPTDNSDIDNSILASDRHGNLHILYERARYAMGHVGSPHYARIRADQLVGTAHNAHDLAPSKSRLTAVSGQPFGLSTYRGYYYGTQTAIAADPENDLALIMMGHSPSKLIKGGQPSEPIDLPVRTFWNPQAVAAGNERFHTIVIGEARDPWWGKGFPVLYLTFSKGQWSAPVELGLADASSFWGMIWYAVSIAGNGGNRALVVWPMPDGIVGRWLELVGANN